MLTVRSSRRRRGRENLFLSATSRRAVVRRRGGGGEIHLYSIAKNTSPRESFLAGLFLSSRVSRLRAFIYPVSKRLPLGKSCSLGFFLWGCRSLPSSAFSPPFVAKFEKTLLVGSKLLLGKTKLLERDASSWRTDGFEFFGPADNRKKPKAKKKTKKKDETLNFSCTIHE